MELTRLLDRAKQSLNVDQILRHQLLWMLSLRIVLYVLLLAISFIFRGSQFDIIVLPTNLLLALLFLVCVTTIFSSFYLLILQGPLRRFGFYQMLLDTIFASLFVFFSGASNSVFTSVFFFPIVAGGLILPRKGGLIAAAAATLQYGVLLCLETYGLYPSYLSEYLTFNPPDPMVSLNHFSVHGLTFFLAAVLSALFGLRLQKAESALSDSLKNFDQLAILYKQIFDNITTGIITIDKNETITSANNAINTITGLAPGTLIGKRLRAIFPLIDLTKENIRQTFDYVKAGDEKKVRIGYSHMIIHKSEEIIKENDPDKIITLRDISEIEQLERQVRQAEKLAAIGMMSASIAHDFRNPLTVISGSAQVLANEFSSESTANYTNYELSNIILREANRLTSTIGDFLKFSRPEVANCNWFSLRSCLDEVLQMLQADPKWPTSTRVDYNFDDNIDIWADEKQLFTVLSHLIQNSIPFCPEDNQLITVSAYESHEADGSDWMQLVIEDNGSGIQQKEKDLIFEPFFTKRPDGTGLGLAIVKQTIEEHQGLITVTDGKNCGAIFTIRLPMP